MSPGKSQRERTGTPKRVTGNLRALQRKPRAPKGKPSGRELYFKLLINRLSELYLVIYDMACFQQGGSTVGHCIQEAQMAAWLCRDGRAIRMLSQAKDTNTWFPSNAASSAQQGCIKHPRGAYGRSDAEDQGTACNLL